MELPEAVSLVRRIVRSFSAVALVATAALAGGCTMNEWSLHKSEKVPPVVQAVATWQNSVAFTPDPVNQGKMTPGLVGRLYVFGSDLAHPSTPEGKVTVALYDESKGGSEMREIWNIDSGTMQQQTKRDAIGMGFSVHLPWANYAPDVNKVRLKVCFEPTKGMPIYTENLLTLSPTNGDIRIQRSPSMVKK